MFHLNEVLSNKKSNKLVKIASILLATVLCILCILPLNIYAEKPLQKEIVKVGIFDFEGFYQFSETGITYGYGFDYLHELSKYGNFQFEFVKGSWSDLQEMLKNGEIDLLDSAKKTEEMLQNYNFSNLPTGASHARLTTSSDNDQIAYNDYPALNGCKVGMLKNNSINNGFDEFSKANNFSTENIIFEDTNSLVNALERGKVDAILTSNMRVMKNEKEILRFSPTPFYMITNKENTILIDKINAALEEIQTNDFYFNQKLYQKYYEADNNQLKFTKNELDYIKNLPPLTVVYDPNWAPFEFYNVETKEFDGVNREIYDMISAKSGIKFEFVTTDSYEKSIALVSKGEYDLLSSFDNHPTKARDLNLVITEPFLNSPIAFIGLDGANFSKKSVIGLPKMYLLANSYVETAYPDNPVEYYDNIFDCYDAILEGKINFTLENIHAAGDIIRSSKYQELEIVQATTLLDSFSIAAKKDTDPLIIGILNKAIASITDEDKTNLINQQLISSTKEITFSMFLRKYINIILLAGVLLILLIGLTSAYIVYLQKKSKQKLWELAYIDPLTKIPNLNKFKIDTEKYISKNSDLSKNFILRFDIDNFKIINERFGYDVGDSVLKFMVKITNEYVSKDAIFARLSNDDFVIFGKCFSDDELITLKYKMVERFSEFDFFIKNHYNINFSSGIYRLQNGDKNVNIMIDKATIAHNQAKIKGNNATVFYSEEFLDNFKRTQDIENSMQTSLDDKDFVIYLQPKYKLSTRTLCGAEALIRWNHPTLGFLPPSEFIPLFEKNGFIIKLDTYVLKSICKYQQDRLNSENAFPLPISVNQSRMLLNMPNYEEEIKKIINKYEIPASLIELEITESMLHDDTENLIRILKTLSDFGVIISIDDFGSGYSSLNLLKDVQADIIKIDREFLVNSESNIRGHTVLSSMISLSKGLGMEIITEGVETLEQESLLKKLGCHMVQGYLYAKPMPIPEYNKLADNYTTTTE